MTDAEIEAVVRGLTDKQRNLLTDELLYIRTRVYSIKRQLRAKGLLAPCDGLTPLGLAVRAALAKETPDDV
jgi:hypothetical protein